MFKLICLLKKRPGMSTEDFRSYYETTHCQIGNRLFAGKVTKYVRRYLMPMGAAEYSDRSETPYDVLTELWFEDRNHWKTVAALVAQPDIKAFLMEDELKLFDRDQSRYYLIEEEAESNLALA